MVHVAICVGCKGKLERAREDLKWYKSQAARERSTFFQISKENIKLKQEIAALMKPRAKR
jgi:hypothetical protein